MTLCVFNFDTKPNIGVGKYLADNCPELEKAKYFAVGSLGPVFYMLPTGIFTVMITMELTPVKTLYFGPN